MVQVDGKINELFRRNQVTEYRIGDDPFEERVGWGEEESLRRAGGLPVCGEPDASR